MKKPEEILKENPGSVIFARYAHQLASEGKVNEAIIILEKGINANPSYALGHSVLANIFNSQKSHEGAADEWSAALKLDPQIPIDLFLYGKYLLNINNRKEARKYLSAASRYEPDNTDILIALDQAMTDKDEKPDLALSDETTEALADMYEMDVQEEIIEQPASDESLEVGGTAIVEALEEAQDELFFDEDVEVEMPSEPAAESTESEEAAGVTEEESAAKDIGDTVISGVYKPVKIEEEEIEGDDFDSLLKSFVDYDEEDEAPADTAGEEDTGAVSVEDEEAEDAGVPETVSEDMETLAEEKDDTLISGVYEAIQEEEEKAAAEDYESLLETFAGDESSDEESDISLEDIDTGLAEKEETETIAPQETGIKEVEEVAEVPQVDSFEEETAASHEDEEVEETKEEDIESLEESFDEDEIEVESQADIVSEEQQNDTDTTSAKDIIDEFPLKEFQNDVQNLMSHFDQEPEGGSAEEHAEAPEETVPETADDVLTEDLPEFGGIEIEEDIAGMETGGEAAEDTSVLQIDEESEYDPSKYDVEATAEEDNEPVLSSQERAELLALEKSSRETGKENGESADTARESVDQKSDALLESTVEEYDTRKSHGDEGITSVEDLYGKLSKEEVNILSEPETGTDESAPDLEEETREGIDYSDVLEDIETAFGEKTVDVEKVFENEPVIQEDTGINDIEDHPAESVISVLDVEIPGIEGVDIDVSNVTLDDLLDDYIHTLKELPEEIESDAGISESRESQPDTGDGAAEERDDTAVSDVTATMAEIYVSQGLKSRAIDIYKTLLKKDPDNDHFINRLDELDSMSDQLSDNS